MSRVRMGSRPDMADVPIPESVFLAIDSIRTDLATHAAGTDLKISKLAEVVEKNIAGGRVETVKIIAGVVTAALGIIGTVYATSHGAPPPTVEHVPARSALDVRLDGCRALKPNSPARAECVATVTAELVP